MIVRSRLAAALTLMVLLAPFQSTLAQEPRPKEPSSAAATRGGQKVPERSQTDNQEPQPDPDQEMRQAIRHLSVEVNSLSAEMRRLRKVTEYNAATMELLLSEERLWKVEDKIQALTDQRSQLDARDQELQRRMRNIPGEMLLRTPVTMKREETEAAIKADLQRALDDVRTQQSSSQTRLVELSAQAEWLRARIVTLRAKVDQPESGIEKQDK